MPAGGNALIESPIKVALIEDQRDIREGLSILINGTRGFRTTGAFGSIESALLKVELDPPDIMLVDIGLPGMTALKVYRFSGSIAPIR